MLHFIGNVLPCCFNARLWSDLFAPMGNAYTSTWIYLDSIPGQYTVLNVTVTKDGYHYQSQRISFIGDHEFDIYLKYDANDTGVYGYHFKLSSSSSNSTLPRNLSVSFYVPLVVQGNDI